MFLNPEYLFLGECNSSQKWFTLLSSFSEFEHCYQPAIPCDTFSQALGKAAFICVVVFKL